MNAPPPPPRTTPSTPADAIDAIDAIDAATLLDEPAPRRWWQRRLLWAGLAVLVVAALAGTAWQQHREAAAQPVYVTQPVTRGPIKLGVSANGSLQPTRSISIGSELSGTVTKVLVDVNDHVKRGQVLVELDTSKLRDQITRSRAALASANAKVMQAVATTRESQANLNRFEEVARLSGGKVPSKAELDTARATQERARADEAAARAGVSDAQAALSLDETNLSKASIRAPADGVVLTRSVDPGNAVAASLQAVTLFTIAEDLKQLRLQVNIDEADVGTVEVGQNATFTVSAYPARAYPARITRVAFGSTTTDNVVTYLTYLEVDNTDLSLRPGMTATATIAAVQHDDALRVPNSALRFAPSQATAAARSSAAGGAGGGRSIVSSLVPQRPSGAGRRRSAERTPDQAQNPGAGTRRSVWIVRDGVPTPIAVRTGISDGRQTEIVGGDLQPGMQVITDQKRTAAT